MVAARTGSSGIVNEDVVSRIADEIAGDSNILDASSIINLDNIQDEEEVSNETPSLPSFPESNISTFSPEVSRQLSFDERQDYRQPSENQDIRPRGVNESTMSINERLRNREEAVNREREERNRDQIDEQQPVSATARTRQWEPRQLFRTERMDVPAYSNSNTMMDTVDLVAQGNDRAGIPVEDAYNLLKDQLNNTANQLEDTSYEPQSQLDEQSIQNSVRRTDEDEQQQQQSTIDSSGVGQVTSAIANAESGDNVDDDSPTSEFADYEPQIREYEFYDLPTIQYSKSQEETKKNTADRLAKKSWDGNAFTEKAIPSEKISPADVSIGSFIIEEIVREPGNNLIDMVNAIAGTSFSVDYVLTNDGMREFADAINSNDIDIVSTKSPVVGPADVVSRRLRVHWGRGIQVHPTQTKAWNLDFDGDGVSISFDMHDGVRNAINYMIGTNDDVKIDIPFFPISKMSGDLNEYIEVFKIIFLSDITSRFDIDITDYAKAMYKISNAADVKGPNEDLKAYLESAWADALREMRKLSMRFSNPDIAMAGILRDLFDNMKLQQQYDIADIAVTSPNNVEQINGFDDQEEPADEWIRIVTNTMAAGKLPPNFQDFITGLHQYIGEIEGKNVMFRIGAKYAKFIKASQIVFKGDAESYRLLYKLTLQAGEAMFMSGRYTIGERVAYMQRIAKNKVQAEIGFPKDYSSIKDFLTAFKTAWNNQMRIIECSNFGGFSCDLDPNPDPDEKKHQIRSNKLSDMVTPLLNVYGDFTISYLFPSLKFVDYIESGKHSKWESNILMLLEGYRFKTLRELSNNNKLSIPGKASVFRMSKDENGNNRSNQEKINFHEIEIKDSTPERLLMTVAGKRTSAASKYNKDTLVPLLHNFVKCFKSLEDRYERRFDNLADYLISMQEMMSALHLSGWRMFDYFNMSDTYNFFNGKWGKLIREAVHDSYKPQVSSSKFKKFKTSYESKDNRAADFVGGIRATMVFKFKLRRLDNLEVAIKELIESADPFVIGPIDPTRLHDLLNRQNAEFDALASTSDLWSVIVAEMRDGDNSAFNTLKANKGKLDEFYIDCNDNCGFWSSNRNADYNSLTEVMEDPYLPKSVKEQVAVDVVRVATGFNGFKSYEMNYQLELETDSAYTTTSLMAYNEQPSVITEISDANNKLRKYFKKQWSKVKEDVSRARIRSVEGDLDSYVKDLAENPDFYLEIPNEFVADAIEAQMDKTSRASEKADQEIQVDGLFNAVEMQRGGLTDAVYRVEARSINMIDESLLSAYDVIRVLADPKLEVTVYNGETRWILSRKTLCGDNSEKALWDLLENNPRIATLLRSSIISSGNKGRSIFKNAKATLYDSMFEIPRDRKVVFRGKIKSYLINKPMFNAMAAMFVPIHNRSSRSVRSQHVKMIDTIQRIIVFHAWEIYRGREDLNIGNILEEDLGVTVDSLISKGMKREPAIRWHQAISEFLRVYINYVIDEFNKESFTDTDVYEIISKYDDIVTDFDLQSISLAIDCRQTFTGAKTKTSTGVEGNITRNHLGTALYASAVHGRHEIIDGDMSAVELAPFVGCLTNFGVFDGTNIDELEELAGDNPLIVEAQDGYRKQDKTLSEDQFQITTLGRFISVNRGEAAEGGNLKAKRSGDDGKDLIAKFKRYSDTAMKDVSMVEKAYADAVNDDTHNNKLFAAKLKLAQVLQKADEAEGYNDMDLSDWMDIAEVMIKEISDDSTNESFIVIRSIGELSAAISRQMDQSIVEFGSPSEIVQAAMEIVDRVGLEGMASDDDMRMRALIAVSGIQSDPGIRKFRPMAKPSEGTFERNYYTFDVITKNRKIQFPWSDKVFDTRKLFKDSEKTPDVVYPFSKNKLEHCASEIFKDGVNGWMKPKNLGKNYNNLFYLPINITRASDSKKKSITSNMSPGPQSVWILESGASKNDIKKAIASCYSFGMTLAFTDTNALGDYKDLFIADVTEAPFGEDGMMMIPFFNIIQSGGAINPPMAPASFDIHESNYSVVFEDPYNFFSIPDAYIMVDERTAKDINPDHARTEPMKIGDIFWNVLHDESINPITGKRVCDMVQDIRLATWDEIRKDIVMVDDVVKREDGVAFDLGLPVSNSNIEDRVKKFDLQVKEYKNDFSMADSNGILPTGKPDRIIAWMRCVVGNSRDSRPIYAPIIPFQTGSSLSVPTKFDIEGVTLKNGNPKNNIYIDWRLSESLDGQLVKVHSGENPAGKSETMFVPGQRIGELINGRIYNYLLPTETDSSRKLGSEIRFQSMISLARSAKLDYKFNFADLPDAFPDDPHIKEALQAGYIPFEKWKDINKHVKRYSSDPDIDEFVRFLVETALETNTTNPTDLLACKFDNRQYSLRYVDYSFFFDPDPEFEDKLLKFYNAMIPNLCPPSIDSYGDGIDPITGQPYLFKPVNEPGSEFSHGCLLTLGPELPHPDGSGRKIRFWGNAVYQLNFFNDEATILHKPSLNGSHATMEQIAAISLSGKRATGDHMRNLVKYATAPAHKTYGWYDMHLDRGAFLRKKR